VGEAAQGQGRPAGGAERRVGQGDVGILGEDDRVGAGPGQAAGAGPAGDDERVGGRGPGEGGVLDARQGQCRPAVGGQRRVGQGDGAGCGQDDGELAAAGPAGDGERVVPAAAGQVRRADVGEGQGQPLVVGQRPVRQGGAGA